MSESSSGDASFDLTKISKCFCCNQQVFPLTPSASHLCRNFGSDEGLPSGLDSKPNMQEDHFEFGNDDFDLDDLGGSNACC